MLSIARVVRSATVPAASAAGAMSVHTEAKLAQLGVSLPPPSAPKGSYVSVVRSGNMLFTAGHLPIQHDSQLITGKVGRELTSEQANAAAKVVALNLLSTLKAELGDLDKIKRVVKLTAFVNCTDGFSAQPSVVNGASDFLKEVLGSRGIHARSAVGTNALPLNVPVEIEAIVEIEA